jgi:hypothetical protein
MTQQAWHVPEAHLPAPGAAWSRQAQAPIRRQQHEPGQREGGEQAAPAQRPDQKRPEKIQKDIPRETPCDVQAHRGGAAVGREHGAHEQ